MGLGTQTQILSQRVVNISQPAERVIIRNNTKSLIMRKQGSIAMLEEVQSSKLINQSDLVRGLSINNSLTDILENNFQDGFVEEKLNANYIKMSTMRLQNLLGIEEEEEYV
ncbi:hypothetical protein SS50377_27183 [Spironucleus salmonicida]|uniref:Uncharacterized protein n=1 Tax=Spironucleus salmonicida TaxID=348837 RepID=V6M7Z5_9EUKA|nr:hypothetical protein SS50377_27183 [Spironucleus salmonicida]|eukprot:EST49599.1 Hypothetical protein SS50377_10042 [Spironucleus salmonicida]